MGIFDVETESVEKLSDIYESPFWPSLSSEDDLLEDILELFESSPAYGVGLKLTKSENYIV